MAAPPVIKIGPPPAKTKGSAWTQFVNKWAKKYPTLKANAPDIQAAAAEAHIDPIYFASVLLTESGANYDTKDSSKGAIGIGQVMPLHVGEPVPWDPTQVVTLQDLRAPAFNLRYSAYYLAKQIGQHGYAHAYDQGYNPGYKGKGPQQFVGSYIPKTPSTAPPTAVGPQAPAGTAKVKPDNTNPYVTIKNGQIVPVSDPGKALTYFGQPLTKSTFMQQWVDLNQHFVAYTGKPATAAQVAAFIAKPVSVYQLQIRLAGSPAFVNSPIYKQSAPNFAATWHAIYGEGSTPDKKAIIAAAAKGLDQTAFADQLRQRTDYTKSEEFKQNSSQMSSVFTKIYGVADDQAQKTIDAVTRQGWSPDQFANWLRQQPQYTGSEEYKSKALAFATQLGLMTGDRPTLSAQQAQLGEPPPPPFPPPQTQTGSGTAASKPKPSQPIQGEAKNEPPFTRKVA